MTLDDLIAEYRSDLDDVKQPYLWSLDDLIRYLNATIEEVCEECFIIEETDKSVSAFTGTSTFTAATKTITGSFKDCGYYVGCKFTVTGTVSNNSTFTITAITATEVTVSESVVNETVAAVFTPYKTNCLIPVTANTPLISLSSLILAVDQAQLASQSVPLQLCTTECISNMDYRHPGWRTTAAGTPWYLLLEGFGSNKAYLWPTPLTNDTLYIQIKRYPLQSITDTTTDIEELDNRKIRRLKNGVYAKAYLKQDVETYNPDKAKFHLELYKKVDKAEIQNTIIKRRHTPTTIAPHLGAI